ncbi:MAG: extracellular solute-binding protein, partial [Anaerolineales bacterium]|nr:extracellular solute-binding protein [Anaerolineales bacterium]MDW8227756.1 extracellular solute-binding protein [Anaerolineales bacterium]
VGLTVDLIPYLYAPRYGLGIEALADFPKAYFVGPGFPAQRSARFLFYNQTWAQELGFSAPPQTPEEFRQQACAANTAFRADADLQNDGLGGWIVDTHWQTIYAWLLAFGGEVSVDDAYTFRTDSNLAAFSFLKTLFDNACAWLTTAEPLYRPFAERKALFVVGDLADVPTLTAIMRQAGNTDIWIPIPFPGSETPIVVVYGPSYTILKTDERTQLAAWLFVRWMVAPERQALWVEQSGLLPLRFSLTPLLSEYRTASPAWAHAISFLPLAQPTPALASWARVRFLLSDGARFMFQTNWPVEKIPFILDTIQSTADEIATP